MKKKMSPEQEAMRLAKQRQYQKTWRERRAARLAALHKYETMTAGAMPAPAELVPPPPTPKEQQAPPVRLEIHCCPKCMHKWAEIPSGMDPALLRLVFETSTELSTKRNQ